MKIKWTNIEIPYEVQNLSSLSKNKNIPTINRHFNDFDNVKTLKLNLEEYKVGLVMTSPLANKTGMTLIFVTEDLKLGELEISYHTYINITLNDFYLKDIKIENQHC